MYVIYLDNLYIHFFLLMIRRPPRSTRTDTLLPYTTLFRSIDGDAARQGFDARPSGRAFSLPSAIPHFGACLHRNRAARCRDIRWYACRARRGGRGLLSWRSEEHTSELQSLMRISYAVFCLKKKTKQYDNYNASSCI